MKVVNKYNHYKTEFEKCELPKKIIIIGSLLLIVSLLGSILAEIPLWIGGLTIIVGLFMTYKNKNKEGNK